jgi:hypothetical protein
MYNVLFFEKHNVTLPPIPPRPTAARAAVFGGRFLGHVAMLGLCPNGIDGDGVVHRHGKNDVP